MDAIQPVGAMIQPPNPQQGLNAYSTLLGLQHQRVGLEQQQQELSQQTSQATVAGQGAKENQNLARLLSDPVGNGITDKEGNPLPDAQQKILSVAPTTGAANYQKVVEAARAKVGFQSDLTTLSAAQRAQVGSVLSADNSTGASREQSVQNLIQLARDNPSLTGVAMRAVAMLPSQPHSTGNPQQDEQAQAQHQKELTDARNGFGRAVVGPENAASLNMPIVGTQFDKTGNLVGTAQSRTTGAFGPAGTGGGGMQVGLGPTDQPEYKGRVAATTAAATNYAGGASAADVERANEVRAATQQSNANIRLTQQVDQLAREINSGNLAAKFAGGANYLGFSSVAEMRTKLQKDLGQLRGAVASRADSDKKAGEILEGYPTDTTPENTIHYAMDYIRGISRQNLARNQLLEKNGTPGFQAADSALTSRTDPLMHEFIALKPSERAGFYQRNFQSKQEAYNFKASIDAARGQ